MGTVRGARRAALLLLPPAAIVLLLAAPLRLAWKTKPLHTESRLRRHPHGPARRQPRAPPRTAAPQSAGGSPPSPPEGAEPTAAEASPAAGDPAVLPDASQSAADAGSDDGGSLERLSLAAALERHAGMMRQQLNSHITQGDNQSVFVDFKAPRNDGWYLPTSGGGSAGVGSAPCDPYNFRFGDEADAACVAWMADLRNWHRLRPLDSVLMDARTLKFRVTFRGAPRLRGVIKLPQLRFKYEPYSELLGYSTDRLLGIGRVPPTAWTDVPVSWLRASAAVAMPAFYVQWLEMYTLNATGLRHLVHGASESSAGFISVSVQLWMHGVRRLRATPMQPPHVHSFMLDPGSRAKWPPRGFGPLTRWALAELSDMYVFDHIIGNNDRTVKKNSFAVGECSGRANRSQQGEWDCSDASADDAESDPDPHRMRPRFVFIDQGSSFYHTYPGRSSHFKANSTVCRFRRRTIERVRAFGGNNRTRPLERAILNRLPKRFLYPKGMSRRFQIQGAQMRLDGLIKFVDTRCLERFPGRRVFPFTSTRKAR
eukprot:TRINITY_DN26061_c0_g1_i1.p1 TRINITY_DN26061_c0_g1~~TRINITY_DN26061_c0_g1_i1.p1  ORF type:complete len:540 (+),score=146.17 TRINITY_DN26061_c0_g1_i1:74-1693(+)